MPRVAAAMLNHRLTPAAYQRAVTLSEHFDVDTALEAGFFDELVEPTDLMDRAHELADEFKQLHPRAHKDSKRRIRAQLIRKIRRSIPLDLIDAVLLALRGGKPR
jgi:enoyl-CoA hydratase